MINIITLDHRWHEIHRFVEQIKCKKLQKHKHKNSYNYSFFHTMFEKRSSSQIAGVGNLTDFC